MDAKSGKITQVFQVLNLGLLHVCDYCSASQPQMRQFWECNPAPAAAQSATPTTKCASLVRISLQIFQRPVCLPAVEAYTFGRHSLRARQPHNFCRGSSRGKKNSCSAPGAVHNVLYLKFSTNSSTCLNSDLRSYFL